MKTSFRLVSTRYWLAQNGQRLLHSHRRCVFALANSYFYVQSTDMLKKETLAISTIRVPVKRMKTLEPEKAMALAEDILENGQLTPIRVREDSKGYVLIEGLHRLEAMKELGEETIVSYKVRARLH